MNPAVYYLSSLQTFVPYVPTEVQIPNGQIWDQFNLNTSVYSDGTPIPRIAGSGWGTLTTGACRFYNNDSSSAVLYGRLYNWYAVNGVDGSGIIKDIAPDGWRVATLDDWTNLSNYYGGNALSAGKLKQFGFDYWLSPNTGALSTNIFNARGGGFAAVNGTFVGLKASGYWWPFGAASTSLLSMAYNDDNLDFNTSGLPNRGYSVRLIKKDITIPGFTTTLGTALARSVPTGGNIPTDYTEIPSEIGIAWGTLSNPNIIANNKIEYIPTGLGPYSINLTELSPNTTYNIRAYAIIASGTAYANNVTFTTINGIATLTTNAVTDITGSTATCGGNITENGGDAITQRGVCWNTSSSPTIANSRTIDGSGNGPFTSAITGLSSSVSYYVRAYATNGVTTSYGNEQVFMTAAVGSLILDIYPLAHHAYSLRKLRTLYTGNSLRVRRTVGATTVTVDVGFDTTTGIVSLNSPIFTIVGGGTTLATNLGQFAAATTQGYSNPDLITINQSIFITTWFDQSGNARNPVQTTPGQQPRLVNAGFLELSGGKVAVRFTRSSSQNLSMADTTANVNNMSSYFVGQFVSTTGSQIGYLLGSTTPNGRFYFPFNSSNSAYAAYGSTTTQIFFEPTPLNRRLYELIAPDPSNSAVASGWWNGVKAVTSVTLRLNATTNIQIGTGGTNYFDGYIQEIIGWESNTNRVGKESNINAYWTIF